MDLARKLAGLDIAHPVLLGAGICKQLEGSEGLENYAKSAAAALMVGSITMESRLGNQGEVFWNGPVASLNSLGMPNRGAEYYRQNLSRMVELAESGGKPLIVSVAGFSADDYSHLTKLALLGGASAVELNLGCPNIVDGGKQKPIASFDPNYVQKILNHVQAMVGCDARVGVKLSPYTNPEELKEIARYIAKYLVVKFVATSNTFPNAAAFTADGQPAISPNGGLGGMSGPALKHIALGQVVQLRRELPPRFDIVGVGGVTNAQDVLDFLNAGATAVQVVTAALQRGPAVFSEILQDLV